MFLKVRVHGHRAGEHDSKKAGLALKQCLESLHPGPMSTRQGQYDTGNDMGF